MMKPNTIRVETVLDNRPEESFGKGSQKLVYFLLMAVGLIAILWGVRERYVLRESWLPEVCLTVGVAIAAPGILSYLYRRYMLDEITIELQRPAQEFKATAELMVRDAVRGIAEAYEQQIELLRAAEHAGLVGVYISRPDAIRVFTHYLEDERHEILLVGSSLKGLLKESDEEYESARATLLRRQSANVRLRWLLTHPVVADLRAKQENRGFHDIGNEIIASVELLLGSKWRIPRQDIKLYLGTPTCFGIKTAQAMLLNTYPYMREAYASPCQIVRKGGYLFEHFHGSHFKSWDSAMALDLPADVGDLRRDLPVYANSVKRLMSQAEAGQPVAGAPES